MENRVDYIISKTQIDCDVSIKNSMFVRAYIGCLNELEMAELLEYAVENDIWLRDLAIRRIELDLKHEKERDYSCAYSKLLKIAQIPKHKPSIGAVMALCSLLPFIPIKFQKEALIVLLTCESIRFRNRAYNFISEHYLPDFEELIIFAWEQNSDSQVAKLAIEFVNTDRLIPMRQSLLKICWQGWLLSKLYIKIGKQDPELVHELSRIDSSTYCFCCYRLDIKILPMSTDVLLESTSNEELLIWCLGRLGEWKILEEIEAKYSELNVTNKSNGLNFENSINPFTLNVTHREFN